MSITS